MAKNYRPQTEIKIAFMAQMIQADPTIGSSRLQSAIRREFGSSLHKKILLVESEAYRQSQKIASPRDLYRENAHLGAVLRKGGYSEAQKAHWMEQINRYERDHVEKDGTVSNKRANFIFSETFANAAESNAQWLKGLTVEAMTKTGGNKTKARELVMQRLDDLLKRAEYDPFSTLHESEKTGAVLSGSIRIRALKRDYTDRRRAEAIAKRDLVKSKVLAGRFRR